MKTIPLTKGYFTKVDDEDYKKFASIRWYAGKNRNTIRAIRGGIKNGKRTTLYLAREIINAPKGKQVDHINGDTLDNRKKNLRICTNTENQRNRGKIKTNTSGYKGVRRHKIGKGHWRAEISVNNKLKHLGLFKTKREAAKVYDKAAKKYHKEFAKLNFYE